MSSKTEILNRIKLNQPDLVTDLPDLSVLGSEDFDILETYKTVLKGIGGDPVEVSNYSEIINYIKSHYNLQKRLITTLPELSEIASLDWNNVDPHSLQDVELTVVKAHFGVAENSALWVTDDILGQRIAPFIAQYLAIIVHKNDIVRTMQQAYERIGNQEYGFGTFIAGPSKTADIEQSLVLGAHGARGLIVFLLD
ncbi:lactate utilization protein B/C [Flavobacterium sp. WLB]|uniref:LutC/YkgG family protein n=1 Tax=unclassified Flavobacterium TaxID=196869 RepID=UPI0006ABDFEC|nr:MULTISPECIES: LUD domain-containing protein [unclassified Flavobacterium]KOP38326.1 lactate utilization protein B/C [Flavobacterium sp. VMW]OWU92176.1 lactate utilization protein B/C [Flavobacterium sp. NLM]PUU71427.1 lactate utilization protein B/C [Flavobacterium sp. WLB]